MRVALGALAAIVILIDGCGGERCGGGGGGTGSACAQPTRTIHVLLSGDDAGAVIAVDFNQTMGVELPGSGRMIKVSDPKRLRSDGPSLLPGGTTLQLFTPVGTASSPSELQTIGGTEVLSAPSQGAHPAWQVTLIVGSDILGFEAANVEAVGESWVYSWPVGDHAPTSSNAQVVAPTGPPLAVSRATLDFPSGALRVDGTFEQQMFYAVGPGKAFAPYEITVKVNPDWSCTVGSGCRQTVVGGSQWPDQHYTYGQTPPP